MKTLNQQPPSPISFRRRRDFGGQVGEPREQTFEGSGQLSVISLQFSVNADGWLLITDNCSLITPSRLRLPAQVPLQVAELHASANSIGSRRALGDSPFSARSRWHSSTSLSASSRFALASPRVSPCEMAAGTSSTKQVYPPSWAGSKTAVSFMPQTCHTAPPLAILRAERLAHAEHGSLTTDN